MTTTTPDSPRFYNRNGTLTGYSFNCGYIERYGDHGSLWAEGDSYHVRGRPAYPEGERVWECFERVADARKFARATFGAYQPASDAFAGI